MVFVIVTLVQKSFFMLLVIWGILLIIKREETAETMTTNFSQAMKGLLTEFAVGQILKMGDVINDFDTVAPTVIMLFAAVYFIFAVAVLLGLVFCWILMCCKSSCFKVWTMLYHLLLCGFFVYVYFVLDRDDIIGWPLINRFWENGLKDKAESFVNHSMVLSTPTATGLTNPMLTCLDKNSKSREACMEEIKKIVNDQFAPVQKLLKFTVFLFVSSLLVIVAILIAWRHYSKTRPEKNADVENEEAMELEPVEPQPEA